MVHSNTFSGAKTSKEKQQTVKTGKLQAWQGKPGWKIQLSFLVKPRGHLMSDVK